MTVPIQAQSSQSASRTNSALLQSILSGEQPVGERIGSSSLPASVPQSFAIHDPAGVVQANASFSQASDGISATAQVVEPALTEPRGQQAEPTEMEDKDVQRLEDRIAASDERAQLRLQLVTDRVEGTLTRIADQMTAMRGELQEHRADNRALRTEIAQNSKWIIGTVLATALALAALIIALYFGFGQIWASGVQTGQALPHASSAAAPKP